ncbi:MAG TPA: hypothetical protein VF610_04475 [Segetibacter sp.]|jgi:hypothetical protein
MEFKKLTEFQRLKLKWKDFEAYQDYKFHRAISNKPLVNIGHTFKEITHFKHSGHSGDIIYSLPAVFALAKNGLAHLHLQSQQAGNYQKAYHPLGNVMLNEKAIQLLQPLLLHQPKIAVCDFYGTQAIDYDLDFVRKFPMKQTRGSISRWYFHVFGIYANLSMPWLTAPKDEAFADHIVISRSHRYRAPGIDYMFLRKYQKKIFIGVPEEFEDMKKQLPDLQYVQVKDFLEMASIINGCRLFIGNQSFPFSIAEALKVNRLLEVYYKAPNVIVEGEGGHDFLYQEHFEKAVEVLYK